MGDAVRHILAAQVEAISQQVSRLRSQNQELQTEIDNNNTSIARKEAIIQELVDHLHTLPIAAMAA